MEIIKELRIENSQLKSGNSDLEYRMSKMEGDISKLTSQIKQTNVSFFLNSLWTICRIAAANYEIILGKT